MAVDRAYNPVTTGTFEISSDGGSTYHRLHNVTDFTLSGGTREENTVQTLDHDPVVSVGKAQPKDLAISLLASPATQGYRIALDGYRNSKLVTVRYTTDSEQIRDNTVTNQTIAVAATGIATGVQTKFDTERVWVPGRGLKLDSTDLIIETITSDTGMTVSRADGGTLSVISATSDWEIWDYAVQIVVPCQVLEAGSFSATTGGDGFGESLTLKSTDVLPVPTYVLA